jgi:hypothetical protein
MYGSTFVALSGMVILSAGAGLAWADDPFQSNPGPAAPPAPHRPAGRSAPEEKTSVAPAPPQINQFDGSWNVNMTCGQAADGAKGYTWAFTAQVRNGVLVGQFNKPGSMPSGTLSGQIQSSGSARLTMDGLTGDPDYNLNRLRAGTPIHYPVTAQFSGRAGTGTREEGRHCDLTFSRN